MKQLLLVMTMVVAATCVGGCSVVGQAVGADPNTMAVLRRMDRAVGAGLSTFGGSVAGQPTSGTVVTYTANNGATCAVYRDNTLSCSDGFACQLQNTTTPHQVSAVCNNGASGFITRVNDRLVFSD